MKSNCLHPVTAWKCGYKFCKSDRVISPRLEFSIEKARSYHTARCLDLASDEVKLPCGHCAACLLQKRKDFSTRLCHEARVHDYMCFITLTYDAQSVPTTDNHHIDHTDKVFGRGSFEVMSDDCLPNKTLLPADVQRFMKRLRRHLEYVPSGCTVDSIGDGRQVVRDREGCYVRDHVSRLRYFAVGEYGTKTKRPHYHILIFGWSPTDREFFCTRKKNVIYLSRTVQSLWKFGHSCVGDVNPQVCKYCARYVTKKFVSTAPIDDRIVPEFTLQSVRDGGMGALWFMKYGEEAVRRGFVTVKSGDNIIKCRVPPYYLHLTRKFALPLWLDVRNERLEFIRAHKGDASGLDDLRCKCECAQLQSVRLSQDDLF